MTESLVPHWLAAGRDVMIGGRTPAKAQELAERLGARWGTLREAAEFGDVVFLAVLQAGVESTLRDAGAAEGVLRRTTLIECTNAIERGRVTMTTAPGSSVSEQIAAATGARGDHPADAGLAAHFAFRVAEQCRPLLPRPWTFQLSCSASPMMTPAGPRRKQSR